MRSLDEIRRQAVWGSLGAADTLGRTVAALGFVQADPIRAPARAQDLILRHRVPGYRVGQLEQRFGREGLEEDFLYAYGFMPVATAALLHPRHDPERPGELHRPDGLAAEVLAFVRGRGRVHPGELAEQFGAERAVNAWGGFSKATTRILQQLHYHGHLRVAERRSGIRVYEAAPSLPEPLSPEERLRRLVLLVVGILAPVSPSSLRSTFALLARGAPGLAHESTALEQLVRSGELVTAEVEGERYYWPAQPLRPMATPARRLRFLAPFDPIVWDRRRFEQVFGWVYRFEAYTPAPKRQFGYYALPMLWGDRVIGWANVAMGADGLEVELGFSGREPKGQDFQRALDAEIARMTSFLRGGATE